MRMRLGLGAIGCALAASVGGGAVGSMGCNAEPESPLVFPGGPGGKTDSLGRGLAGIASDYVAAELDDDALASNMRLRRDAAWNTVEKILTPVPLLGLAEDAGEHPEIELPNGEIPRVARWQTWYGITDIKRMFQHIYEGMGPSERAVHASPNSDTIKETIAWNAKALDRSSRWPLERYFAYVRSLGICPENLDDDACARLVKSRFGGAVSGNARILYSPAVVTHVLRNYEQVIACLDSLDDLPMSAEPTTESNFTACFDSEFEANSVLVKAQWQRADFDRTTPAFDTDADTLRARLAQTAQWPTDGDRQRRPDPSDIFTIQLRGGETYRLVGLHIMTKELRHWQWITLWWSDKPNQDFGADRPHSFSDSLPSVWNHYKMCVVGSFEEKDREAAARFTDLPTLAAAIDTTGKNGEHTWCSNPYIEHGRNNAGTNCIGCHQHGGSTVDLDKVLEDDALFPDRGRQKLRELFPTDYLYSFNRVDDFAHMLADEVSFFDDFDRDSVLARVNNVLSLTGIASAGSALFAERCTGCHGPEGAGTSAAPNLGERVPMREDSSLIQTLISGRGGMPSWGELFSNQELANLHAFLRATF